MPEKPSRVSRLSEYRRRTSGEGRLAVREIVNALDRTLRADQLYPQGSTVTANLREQLFGHLAQYLETPGSLTLTVECDEIYAGDDLVFDAGRDERSFAFTLFDGGVRELTFRHGLEASELSGLVAALHQAGELTQESVATLLWQRGLTHVSFLTVDLVEDGDWSLEALDLERLGSRLRDRAQDRAIHLEQIAGFNKRKPNEATDGGAQFSLDPAALGKLARRAQLLESDDPTLNEALDLGWSLFHKRRNEHSKSIALQSISRLVLRLVESGRPEIALEHLNKVAQVSDGESASSPIRVAGRKAINEFTSTKVIGPWVQDIRSYENGSLLALRLVKILGESAIDVARHLIGNDLGDDDLIEALARATAGRIGVLHDQIVESDAEAALVAVRVPCRLDGKRATRELLLAARHLTSDVRSEALAGLTASGDPVALLEVVARLREEDESSVRRRGFDGLLRQLAQRAAPELFEPLKQLIELPTHRLRSDLERRLAFGALALADPKTGTRYLERILLRFHFLRRSEADHNKLLVVRALSRSGTAEARALLARVSERGHARIRKACRDALRKLERLGPDAVGVTSAELAIGQRLPKPPPRETLTIAAPTTNVVVACSDTSAECLRVLHASGIGAIEVQADQLAAVCADQHVDVAILEVGRNPKFAAQTASAVSAARTPLLIVTGVATSSAWSIFDVLAAGAVDAISTGELASRLVAVVRSLATSRARPSSGNIARPPRRSSGAPVVGIVASAGGPRAVVAVLKSLSQPLRAPILLVQHVAPVFLKGLPRWLHDATGYEVELADEGTLPLPGRLYLAPPDRHLTYGMDGILMLDKGPRIERCRPSATPLFASLADRVGTAAIGAVLTGAGTDGLEGLAAIHKQGGTVIAQSRETSMIAELPETAVARGIVNEVLPLPYIGAALERAVRQQLGV